MSSTESGPEIALSIQNMSVSYQSGGFGGLGSIRHQALAGLSVDLFRGEILTLVGKSGSGKSTLARAIMGRVPLESGRVFLSGQLAVSTSGQPRPVISPVDLRKRIQLVHQAGLGSLSPGLSVVELLGSVFRTGGYPSGQISESIDELMRMCGLDEALKSRLPSQISGGQRQRVLIARALAMDADILVLDEPVASLDVSVQARILNLLVRLRRDKGLSMIFITHDLDIAQYIGDRIAVLNEGRIVECGPVEDIIANPGHPYTKELLAGSTASDLLPLLP